MRWECSHPKKDEVEKLNGLDSYSQADGTNESDVLSTQNAL